MAKHIHISGFKPTNAYKNTNLKHTYVNVSCFKMFTQLSN